jgi:hypothetical protein
VAVQGYKSEGRVLRFPMRSLEFSVDLIVPSALWLWVDSVSNRIEYQESEADNLTAICEPAVSEIWELRRPTTIWATTTFQRNSLTFFAVRSIYECIRNTTQI